MILSGAPSRRIAWWQVASSLGHISQLSLAISSNAGLAPLRQSWPPTLVYQDLAERVAHNFDDTILGGGIKTGEERQAKDSVRGATRHR